MSMPLGNEFVVDHLANVASAPFGAESIVSLWTPLAAAAGYFPTGAALCNATAKYTRNRMRMRQVAFCTYFTGSRAASQAKSLPMISCMRKGKFGWVNDSSGAGMRLCLISGGICLW